MPAKRFSSLCLLAIALAATNLTLPSALAGPNAGGTLILHAHDIIFCLDGGPPSGDANLCETGDTQDPLLDCADAVTNVSDTSSWNALWSVYAAFPATSAPRLAGITFGVSYDEDTIVINDDFGCGDFQLPTDGWPRSGEGTAVTWTTAETDILVHVYAFLGYEYYGLDVSFDLIPHPTQGAMFADDDVPSNLEPIAALGSLGFNGNPGTLPCPPAGEPLGACCFAPNCICLVLTADECLAEGGDYLGDDSSCDPNPCACITGACCFDDGSCGDALMIDCEEAGGRWLGEGTSCEFDDCDPVPTLESSWGRVKSVYRQ